VTRRFSLALAVAGCAPAAPVFPVHRVDVTLSSVTPSVELGDDDRDLCETTEPKLVFPYPSETRYLANTQNEVVYLAAEEPEIYASVAKIFYNPERIEYVYPDGEPTESDIRGGLLDDEPFMLHGGLDNRHVLYELWPDGERVLIEATEDPLTGDLVLVYPVTAEDKTDAYGAPLVFEVEERHVATPVAYYEILRGPYERTGGVD